MCNGLVPEVWDIKIEHGIAPAVYKALMENRTLTVGQLMRDNADREAALPAIVLMIVREGQCSLQNANALNYILTRQDRQAGRLWQLLFSKRAKGADKN
jgi:voltage-gated potassium channel